MDEPVKHANIQERSNVGMQHQANLTTIKYFAHLARQRWSYETPWGHPSPNNTAARHAHQQQHECTNIVVSSLVISHVVHIPTVGHIVDKCNITWKYKRPACHMKSHVKLKGHGSEIVMREVEQSQRSVSPSAINTPSFVHAKDSSPWLLPHSLESL